MKKILFAALALTMLATVCLSQAAFAENFVEVDRTERNIAYLDTDSIKDNGGYLTAVTKIKKPAHLWTFSRKSRYAGFFSYFCLMSTPTTYCMAVRISGCSFRIYSRTVCSISPGTMFRRNLHIHSSEKRLS